MFPGRVWRGWWGLGGSGDGWWGGQGGLVLVVTFGLAKFRGYGRAVSCIVSCVCLLCRAEGFVMCCCLRFSWLPCFPRLVCTDGIPQS